MAVLVLAGCDTPTRVISNERPIDPLPPEYATWYAEVEECLGQPGAFASVSWLVASELSLDGRPSAGATRFPHDIIVYEGALHSPAVVKHEAVHHITQMGDEMHGTEPMMRCAYGQ